MDTDRNKKHRKISSVVIMEVAVVNDVAMLVTIDCMNDEEWYVVQYK